MPGLLNTEAQPAQEIEGIPTEDEAMGTGQQQPLNERIEPSIREQLEDQQNKDLDRVLDAGMKILFGKETHNQLFDSVAEGGETPIEDTLGMAATNIMLEMFKKSSNSIPGEVIIPAGTILLARSVDFINESGIAQVSDEAFGQALEMFVDVLQSKLDPEYGNKLQAAEQGQQQGEQDGQAQMPVNDTQISGGV